MRRLMATALILLLLVPMLVCAAPVCPHHSQPTQSPDFSHCDEKPDQTSTEQATNLMLFADCLGIDLEHAVSPPQANTASFLPEPVEFSSMDFWVALSVEGLSSHQIRGSPPTPHPASVQQQAIYLKTQRFRV